ncbi:hypothetical protein HUT06_32265 [Actinomadura sp. NAK00032]|uniref:hypothetical protein n=1 Tax=Actinomadura sp. NAK00032 TaxID=2742128 RepID=UPI001591ACFF|nr:hypothetical protein [Actinomadura sp. NAK00032]QKW38103.1 hypothetical protein HUT06_32265 [Actinomadura sp. NAK00032]
MADDTPVPSASVPDPPCGNAAPACRLHLLTTGVLALFAALGAAVVVASFMPRGHRGRRRLRRSRPWNRGAGSAEAARPRGPSGDRTPPDDEG